MTVTAKVRKNELEKEQKKLFEMLDKGIDDMENGRTVEHDEAMRQIREKITQYDV